MTTTDIENRIRTHMRRIAHRESAAYAAWMEITKADLDSRPSLLRYAVEVWNDVEEAKEDDLNVFLDRPISTIQRDYGEVSDTILRSLVNRSLSSDEFYRDLYASVASPVFPDDLVRGWVIHNIFIDPLVPYYEIPNGLLAMPNEEFKRIRTEVGEPIKRFGITSPDILARERSRHPPSSMNLMLFRQRKGESWRYLS